MISAIVLLKPSETNAETKEGAVVVETTVKEPEYNHAVRERFGTDNRENARIILQANQKTGEAGTWVEIKDARGRTELSRVMMPGDVYYVPNGGEYKATIGNAGGIDVWVDRKLAPQIGAEYEKKTGVVLTPESLMKNAK